MPTWSRLYGEGRCRTMTVDTDVGAFDDGDEYEEVLIPQGLPVLYLQDPESGFVQTFIGWGDGLQYFTNFLHGYRRALLLREYARQQSQLTGSLPYDVMMAPDQILVAIHTIAEDN